ncbi:helix-turn-helix domain-containing protein [Halanaeroarchaeum sulfurireducens]|uniref:TrmB family transcriptional regulator n=1 Tax=Halanaeroarchaeum sulfurireducens TaxID=1604004 RepID=A0A0F7P9E0_9EURY|nr:helix-turn-helix domain-containing protein [Halanaeroarchaeum sulfurireducens]AKH97751.1 TrmB family transcriptional regulator [Halanaeroarchaeum sulfurireducens]ALG82146.1 TrmB family transcriptional regulator [Halanaeroarchaeum sulfurireducens]
MVTALNRDLERDLECDGLLECLYDLNELDRECFTLLSEAERRLTIDEIAERVGRERSTAYRSVQRLLEAGLVQKKQINYDQGGYYHEYTITDPDSVADTMQEQLNDWYAQIGYLIGRFREKYGEGSEDVGSPPPVT